jgi:hypothetical protein
VEKTSRGTKTQAGEIETGGKWISPQVGKQKLETCGTVSNWGDRDWRQVDQSPARETETGDQWISLQLVKKSLETENI